MTASRLSSTPNDPNTLISCIDSLLNDRRLAQFLRVLQSTAGEHYLVGGAVRDLLMGIGRPRDIDLIVPNGDRVAHGLLRKYDSGSRNRHGNWRYRLTPVLHVDIIEPRFFYREFEEVRDTLRFFDASVNAIGVRLHDNAILDPLNGQIDISDRAVTLPEERWESMSDFESVHLCARLVRLLSRFPLTVRNPVVALKHLPKFERVDWGELYRLNSLSRDQVESNLVRLLLNQ